MRKSELETGCRVELNNGSQYIVLRNVDTKLYGNQELLFAGVGGFVCGDSYQEDLTCMQKNSYDVKKIYEAPSDSYLLDIRKKGDLLFERPPIK